MEIQPYRGFWLLYDYGEEYFQVSFAPLCMRMLKASVGARMIRIGFGDIVYGSRFLDSGP